MARAQQRIDDEPGHEKRQTLEREAVKLVEHLGNNERCQQSRSLHRQQVAERHTSKQGIHCAPPENLRLKHRTDSARSQGARGERLRRPLAGGGWYGGWEQGVVNALS